MLQFAVADSHVRKNHTARCSTWNAGQDRIGERWVLTSQEPRVRRRCSAHAGISTGHRYLHRACLTSRPFPFGPSNQSNIGQGIPARGSQSARHLDNCSRPYPAVATSNLASLSAGFFYEKTPRPPPQAPARQIQAQREMLRPLLDRVLVEVDDSIAETSLYIPIRADKWRAKDGAVESYNRGRVVSCGPGKRHPETRQCYRMDFDHPTDGRRPVKEGDVIRFSELAYPEDKENGKRYALITEGDIVGVEA